MPMPPVPHTVKMPYWLLTWPLQGPNGLYRVPGSNRRHLPADQTVRLLDTVDVNVDLHGANKASLSAESKHGTLRAHHIYIYGHRVSYCRVRAIDAGEEVGNAPPPGRAANRRQLAIAMAAVVKFPVNTSAHGCPHEQKTRWEVRSGRRQDSCSTRSNFMSLEAACKDWLGTRGTSTFTLCMQQEQPCNRLPGPQGAAAELT